MTRFDFCKSTTDGLELPLLFLKVNLNRVGDEVVGTPAGSLGQPVQFSLDCRCEADADGCASCASHEHRLARCTDSVNLISA